MLTPLNHITSNLRDCFDGKPWYGISIIEKLNQVPWEVVNERQYGSKSIAVLVQHIINWRIFVLKKLQGDTDYDLKIDSVEDWTQVHISNEKDWEDLIELLKTTQKQLLEKLAQADASILESQVPGKDYTFRPILTSISQHDIYHLGQIAMLNAMQSK